MMKRIENWELKSLGDLGEVVTGNTPSKKHPEYYGNAIPWVKPSDLDRRDPISRTDEYLSKEGTKHARVLPENTVMVSCIGNLGKVGIAGARLATNQQINSIIFNEKKVYYKYGYYACKRLQTILEHYAPATTLQIITKSRFSEIRIPVPPLSTQRKIASILDKCESARSKREEANCFTDEFLKSLFLDMFGDPMKERKNIKKLSEICEINPSLNVKLSKNTEVSFIPMSAVSEKGNINTSQTRRYEEVKNGFTYFKNEDVLFAKITPCMENGKGAIARNLTNGIGFGSTEFHVLRPNNKDVNSEWVYFLLSLEHIRQIAARNMTGTAGQKRVPVSFLKNFDVSVPSLTQQQKFADIVKKVEKLKEKQRKSEEELNNLFNSLMQKAFRGGINQ